MALPEINDRGEVSLEGHLIGSIEGFRFSLSRSEEGDSKGLRAAAAQVIAPEIRNRAERLAGGPNEEFILATDGLLRWKGEIVAQLAEGDSLYAPRLIVLADDSLTGVELARVEERLSLWLRHHVNTQLESVIALAEPADLEGTARGVAFRIYEQLGILPRQAVAEDVKGLDQDVRAKLRKHGIKFGAYHIYLPLSLKPAPRELAIILYALKHGGVRQPGVTELPHSVLSGRTSFLIDPEVATHLYEVAGFKVAGRRAVRVDILERLADIIRPLIAFDPKRAAGPVPPGAAEGNGFKVTVEMTSLLGCSGEDFASILSSLGYRMRRVPKPVVVPEAAGPAETIDETQAPQAAAEAAKASPEAGSEAEASPAPTDGTATSDIVSSPEDIAELAALDGATVEEVTEAVDDYREVAAASSAATTEAADRHATAAVEGHVNAEEEPVATAADDLGSGPLPASQPAAEAVVAVEPAAAQEPQEPAFDEIWSPGGRRHEHHHENRHEGRRENRHARNSGGARDGKAAAPAPAINTTPVAQTGADGAVPTRQPNGNGRRFGRHDEGRGKPGNGQHGRPHEDRKEGGDRAERGPRRQDKVEAGPRSFPPKPGGRPQRETAFDPDPPFAALAVLRDRKPE